VVLYKKGFPLASLIVLLVVTSQSHQHGLSASKMKYSFSLAAFAAFVAATPTPTLEERDTAAPGAACASAVTIAAGSNPFSSRTLHANSAYASEIAAAMATVTDTSIQAQGAEVAKVGTFLWM
jgi:cellulose 1,4-beta-cellobiosidase